MSLTYIPIHAFTIMFPFDNYTHIHSSKLIITPAVDFAKAIIQ